MGLFDFLRGRDERAIPEPGTPEFDAAVAGSALPDAQTVQMGSEGWNSTTAEPDAAEEELTKQFYDGVPTPGGGTINLRGVEGARQAIVEALRRRGIDPETGQRREMDADSVEGLQEEIMGILKHFGVQIPGMTAGLLGIGANVEDRLGQLEQLRDAGMISDTEYEQQRARIEAER